MQRTYLFPAAPAPYASLTVTASPPVSPAGRALRWIAGVLRELEVPFLVTGGLAARAHGATRPLVDIDLYVPGSRFPDIVPRVAPHRVFGPEAYRDEQWDLTFMALEVHGQRVELGDGDATRFFDRRSGRWVRARVDYERAVPRRLYGIDVPVMDRATLIDYKRRLGRPVDLRDVEDLMRQGP